MNVFPFAIYIRNKTIELIYNKQTIFATERVNH